MESIINGTYQPANKNNTNEDQQLSNVDRPRQVKFRNQHLGPSGSDDNTESCETDEMVSIHFEHTDASNFNNVSSVRPPKLLPSCLFFQVLRF